MVGMKYRKLRIAFAAVCAVLCLLLIALWVRSYFQRDNLSWTGASSPNELQIASYRGSITLVHSRYSGNLPAGLFLWTQTILGGSTGNLVEPQIPRKWGVGSRSVGGGIAVSISCWLPTILFAMLTAAPWLPRRFSLRTLLIGMTVVAAVLGLVVWVNS
jgi:hypothetical protein